MDKNIFRKVSIERLSSPEQLDRMITITSLKSWFILMATVLILSSIIIWSITGSLTTNVNAQGMLVKSGGIYEITSTEQGLISDIRVLPGDYIKKGDIIARLSQKELVEEITILTDKLIRLKISDKDAEEINGLEEQIKERKKKLQSSSVIVAHEEGRVVEIKPQVGDMVTPGTVILSVVKEGVGIKNLIAVLYVPVESGKLLSLGMETRISPSTVKKEEYGYILGRIVSISEYPVTVHTAGQKLGSNELAEAYVGKTACLEVLVDLVTATDTPSGFKWSTLSGPPIEIGNGTVCNASVIVDRQRPIELLIPQIKNVIQ